MMLLRHLRRFGANLGRFAFRSGRWWLPVVIVVLVVASVLIATFKAVVPVAVYTLL